MDKRLGDILLSIEAKPPLVHCLTHPISINDMANMILAVGASPIMAVYPEEVAEITGAADSLVINIGNIDEARIKSIFFAGEAAQNKGIPVVFDPVGVSCSSLRYALALDIIDRLNPNIIKGNIAEIKTLLGVPTTSRGVDALEDTEYATREDCALVSKLAKELNCVVVASGAVDIVAGPDSLYTLHNGNKMLRHVTGTGCVCGGLLGVYAAYTNEYELASVLALSRLNIAAELAADEVQQETLGIGSFKIRLLDKVYNLTLPEIIQKGKIICVK